MQRIEYDAVQIVNDFITEEKIKKLKNDVKEGIANVSKIYEEINLLYVAVTRTKHILHIPQSLMPLNFAESEQIHVLNVPVVTEEEMLLGIKLPAVKKTAAAVIKEKSYTVNEVRERHGDAYQPWTPALDMELTEMYCERKTLKEMAKHFGRTPGAVKSRIKKLELVEIYG